MALDKNTFYPLADWGGLIREPGSTKWANYRAKWTGEKRPPNKGEWYLSGAIIAAYKAPSDLTIEFHIAKIYKVHKVEYWEEVKDGS